MSRLFKLVVLALTLAVGLVPAFADVSCAPIQAGPGMCCAPGCQMMARMAKTAGHALQGTGALPACCRVPCSKPVHHTELQAPVPTADVTVHPADDFVGALLAATRVQRDRRLPLPDSAFSQSVLCTFLI